MSDAPQPTPVDKTIVSDAPTEAPFAPTKLPRGLLPDGINVPPGTDIMQFIRDLAESGADFAEQFDRDSATFHGNNYGGNAAVPMGGARVPESMGKDSADWEALPDAPLAIEEDFGADYHIAMEAHTRLGECKKAISVLNKPVEMAMRVRHQYLEAKTEEDQVAMKSRMKGAEDVRDGALASATVIILNMSDKDVSERTRSCVKDVVERGKFHFEDKETFGEYMQVLQRANQAIFADQKRLLARLKDIKKAAKAPMVVSQKAEVSGGYAGSEDAVPTSATVAAGA